MKYVFFLLMPLFFFATGYSQHQAHDTLKAKKITSASETIYTCPMHPEVQAGKPGTCPKCGMALVKKKVNGNPVKEDKDSKEIKEQPGQDTLHHGHSMEHDEEPAVTGIKADLKPGKTVRYDLYITDTIVNYTGKPRHAYAINGTIPGPDLVFTEGDTAEIYLHNLLRKEETSLHWHGVILPNRFDGVPYLTTAPVHPGDVHLYKFAVVQNGTYWYHSHSGLQEQAGIYGALIFHKRKGQELAVPGNRNHEQGEYSASHHDNHNMHDMSQDGNHSSSAMPVAGNGSYHSEQTVVLSEWTDEKPNQVQRRLRTVNDWYAIKKGSTQSYSEAIRAGHFRTRLMNEWKRMNAMDVSDVYYDRFLINGQPEQQQLHYKKGDRIRLRVVNAGASSYFWVQFAGGKMTVIANDGNDVVPVEVDRLIVGVSETYDVVVTLPENMSYEFRATPEDRTKATSLWLGSGMKMPAPHLPRLKYFEGMKMMNDMMKMNGDMKEMDMEMSLQQMDMNMVMYDELNNSRVQGHDAHQMNHGKADSSQAMNHANHAGMNGAHGGPVDMVTLNYAMLKSPHKTMLPDVPAKELFFTLTGNMNRYVWSINNKVVSEWDKILIDKGQNVRIVLFNNSMMRHPMHLHGHDFRVVNGQGEYAPFKNVLDIMPMETDTIEFAGSQDGDWFFHCHILYHMMAGMGNVFSYKNSLPNPELPDKAAAYNQFIRGEKMIHPMAEIGLESNGSDGMFMLAGERYEFRTEWRIGLKSMHGNEVETYLGRYIGKMQWLFPFIGFDYHKNTMENAIEKNVFGQFSNQDNRKAFVAGVEYVLPMLVRAQFRMDSKGKFRIQLGREDIPVTPRLRLNAMWNTDREYMAGLRYIVRKWFALSTHYDSDMGYGAGVTIIY